MTRLALIAGADVSVSGVGHAEVNVTHELEAVVTGLGDIDYHGDPTVRRDVTGLGDVNRAT
jgi:Putative auto-transporter adhesin, head GIN domain